MAQSEGRWGGRYSKRASSPPPRTSEPMFSTGFERPEAVLSLKAGQQVLSVQWALLLFLNWVCWVLRPGPFPQCDFSPPTQTNKQTPHPGKLLISCLAGYVILFHFNFLLRFPSIASSTHYFVKPFEFLLLSGVSSISEILHQLITVWYFWPTSASWWDS